MNNKYVAIVVVALIVVGGGSFYGGMQYDKSVTAQARASARGQFGGGAGGNGQGGQGGQQRSGMIGGRGQGGGFVIGEVLSKDDKSLTVKTPDGGSTIIYFSSSMNVRKADIGSLSDLVVGQQVMINGKNSPDGSILADTISITPAVTK